MGLLKEKIVKTSYTKLNKFRFLLLLFMSLILSINVVYSAGTITFSDGNVLGVSNNLLQYNNDNICLLTGSTFSGDINMNDNIIINIGDSDTDFTSTGGLNLADDLDMSGDIDMNTNVITDIGNSGTDFNSLGGLTLADDLIINGDLTVSGTSDIGRIDVVNASQILTSYNNTVNVAKQGADFTSIQDAIDSITDASSNNRYGVKVACGEYTENIVAKDFVYIFGEESSCTYLNVASGTGYDATGVFVSGIWEFTIDADYGTLTQDEAIMKFNTGFHTVSGVRIIGNKDDGNYKLSAFQFTGSTTTIFETRVEMTYNSSVAGSPILQEILSMSSSADIKIQGGQLRASNYDSNDILTGIGISSGSAGMLRVLLGDIALDQYGTGISAGLYTLGASTEIRLFYSTIDIDTYDVSTSYGAYIDSSFSGAIVETYHMNLQNNPTGGGTSYGAFIDTGDQWQSNFDIIYANVTTQGGGDFDTVLSYNNGILLISEQLEVNSNTIINGSGIYTNSINVTDNLNIGGGLTVGGNIEATVSGVDLILNSPDTTDPLFRTFYEQNVTNTRISQQLYQALNNASQTVSYARVVIRSNSQEEGNEGGEIRFSTMQSGSLTETFVFDENGYVGIGTNNPSERLDVIGNVEITGDLSVSGAILTDIYYGEMYIFDNALATTISIADTYYNVTNGMTQGELNGFTYSGGVLTATNSGTYSCGTSASFSGGNSVDYNLALGVNGVRSQKCHISRKLGTGGDVGNTGSTCILSLSSGDELTLMIAGVGSTSNPTVTDGNLNCQWVGS